MTQGIFRVWHVGQTARVMLLNTASLYFRTAAPA
jgi:hypothetical protein